MASEAIQKLPSFNAQNLSNTLWAFAKVQIRHDELFAAAMPAVLRQIRQFKTQNLSNTVWAYAKARTWS